MKVFKALWRVITRLWPPTWAYYWERTRCLDPFCGMTHWRWIAMLDGYIHRQELETWG